MTKNELKAALDLSGIGYKAKITLGDLVKLYNAHCVGEGEPLLNEDGTFPDRSGEILDQIISDAQAPEQGFAEVDGKPVDTCPSCGIHLSNGLLHVDDCAANTNKTYREQRDPEFAKGEWQCMGCGHNFGAIPEFAPEPGTGLKIEKDRPEQNGIKRPSVGGKCRAIWDALDAYREETGELPTSKVVKELAADEGWNPNNASIEFYQWRKFHGISKSK